MPDPAAPLSLAQDAASPSTSVSGWPAGALHLAAHLAFARPLEIRRRATDLYTARPRPQGAALMAQLAELAAAAIRDAGTLLAEALGCDAGALLRFAHPLASASELTGTRGRLRRLDRIWGTGASVSVIEAISAFHLAWPGPHVGLWTLLQGEAWACGVAVVPGTLTTVPSGMEIHMLPGCLAALPRMPVANLMATAREAGLNLEALLPELAGDARTVSTAAGSLDLEGQLLRLNDRTIRLSDVEATILLRLAEKPGHPISRGLLAQAIGRSNHRSLDKVMGELRDKLGDGVITTVHRVGYALEVGTSELKAQHPGNPAHSRQAAADVLVEG